MRHFIVQRAKYFKLNKSKRREKAINSIEGLVVEGFQAGCSHHTRGLHTDRSKFHCPPNSSLRKDS